MQLTKPQKAQSLLARRVRKFARNRLAMLGLIIVAVMLALILLAPLISPYAPDKPDFSAKNAPPSREHLLGTDNLGRDIFSRILYGGRMSLLIALIGSVSAAMIGVVLGSIAGYFGGIVDSVLVRISELFQTFPQLILVMMLMSFVGQGVGNLILIFSVTGWVGTFRQVRAEFLSLKEETYVEVARAFGMSRTAIMFKEILPSVSTTIIIQITMALPGIILSEAGLSYLGVGVPSSVPTWGNMLNAAKSLNVIMNYWWMWVTPGVAICLFVLSVNFIGDGLRDVLDPRQQ